MQDPDLYSKYTNVSKEQANALLKEFTITKKWRENAKILDIGCGDGSVNKEVLQKFAPASCQKIVGCDISAKMIEYAKEHYENELVEFLVWDVAEEPPLQLRGAFDHVFSFYVMHWVKKQEAAFLNIYNTLKEGGNCFLLFLAYNNMFEVFRTLSVSQKWAEELKDVEIFISPYCDSQDPPGEVTRLMEKVGFNDVDVQLLKKNQAYNNVDMYKNFVKSINPFKALNEKWDDFMKDYFEVAPGAMTAKYTLILAYGSK